MNRNDVIPTTPGTTLDDVRGLDRSDRGLWLRRATVLLLVCVQLAALSGWLGVRSKTASARANGYQLQVTYAAVARAGLDVPLTIRVQAPYEITGHIVVGISADYFRMFETQGFFPEPTEATADGDTVFLTFTPPPSGSVYVIDYDGYIQPANQRGKEARVSLLVDGTEKAAVQISTALLP